ncbi:MAG: Hsp20/alpha crystallin family protein [Candidatus Helarchaeota archaeon]
MEKRKIKKDKNKKKLDDSNLESDKNNNEDDNEIKINEIKFSKLDNIIDQIMDKELENLDFFNDKENTDRQYIWGFSLTVTPDSKPIIREFEKKRENFINKEDENVWEPLIEVMEQDNGLLIIIEIPNTTEDEIKLTSYEDYCELSINSSKNLHKQINFPFKVDPKSEKMKYKNGILEILYSKL